jgi:hypothetical protein
LQEFPDKSPTLRGNTSLVKIGEEERPPTLTGMHLFCFEGGLHFMQHPLFFTLSFVNQIVNRKIAANTEGTSKTAAATEVPSNIQTSQKIAVRKTPTSA